MRLPLQKAHKNPRADMRGDGAVKGDLAFVFNA